MKRPAAPLAAALALVALAPLARAEQLPPETTAALDALVAEEMAEGNLPSVAVSVQTAGRAGYETAVGAADLDSGAARLLGDPFRAGGVTKLALATVVLQLAAEGRLALDAPAAAWFPDLPGAERITVDDLLRMRSGLADAVAPAERYDAPTDPPAMDEAIARAADRGGAPGEAVYADVNYMMLDEIVAAVEGRPTAEVLAERIFAPLALSASAMPEGPDLRGALHGYGWNAADERFEDRTALDPGPAGGAGALVSSAADLAALVRAVCAGDLLPPDLQALRVEAAPLGGAEGDYGQGVMRLGPFCGHDGAVPGFSTEAWHWPERDVTIVVNVARADRDGANQSAALFRRIAKELYPADMPW